MTDIRATTSQDPQSAGTAILGGGAASLASRPELMPAHALEGDPVVNPKGYALGRVEHIVIDVQRGRIAYAVLTFGGFLGLGEKLFAILKTSAKFGNSECFPLLITLPAYSSAVAQSFA